jgi:hypothetical protein
MVIDGEEMGERLANKWSEWLSVSPSVSSVSVDGWVLVGVGVGDGGIMRLALVMTLYPLLSIANNRIEMTTSMH